MIRTKLVRVYEVVCDGCRATTPLQSAFEVPHGWIKVVKPANTELDEFYGWVGHYCPLCQYFANQVPKFENPIEST